MSESNKVDIFIVNGCAHFGHHIAKYLHDCYKDKISSLKVGLYDEDKDMKKEFEGLVDKVIMLQDDCQDQLKGELNEKYEALIIPSYKNIMKRSECVIKALQEAKVHCSGLISWNGVEHSKGEHLSKYFKIEQCFKESKLNNTCIIRLDVFQQELKLQAPAMQDKGMMVLNTGDQKFSPVCSKDSAMACTNLLVKHNKAMKAGETSCLLFSGPSELNGDGLAKVASEVLDVEYKFKSSSRHETKEVLSKNDVPMEKIELLLDYYDLVCQGHAKGNPEDLKAILGKNPMPVDVFFKENASYFKPRK